MKPIITQFIYITVLTILLASCAGRQKNTEQSVEAADSLTDEDQLYITYKNTVFCIPSPQQMNMFIKRIGVMPDKAYINKAENISNYNSNFKKAINLGVYGADIGYINMYLTSDKTSQYLMSVKKLSDGLGLEQIVDEHILDHINATSSNHDSLLVSISEVYKNTDKYLKENSREEVSVLVVAGGWVETLYILSQHYSITKRKELIEIIGQQKYPIEFVIKILAPYYKSSPEVSELEDELVDLAYDFDAIDFKYSYNNPMFEEKDNVYMFNNSCEMQNTSPAIDSIINKISKIRNKLIQ